MGSQQLVEAEAPQQELPPDFTRKAACPYRSWTTCVMSLINAPLLAQLNDGFRLHGPAACAALRIQKAQQFLEGIGIGRVPEKSAFAPHVHQIFALQLFQVVRQRGIRDTQLVLNFADNEPLRMSLQQQ